MESVTVDRTGNTRAELEPSGTLATSEFAGLSNNLSFPCTFNGAKVRCDDGEHECSLTIHSEEWEPCHCGVSGCGDRVFRFSLSF